MSTAEAIWLTVGAGGQVGFGMRMLVQWYASEQAKKSVVPPSYWYISLGSSVMMLAYAVWRLDPIFIFGQSLPLPIYFRNVMLIARERREQTTAASEPVAPRLAGPRLADVSRDAAPREIAPAGCSCPCTCGIRQAA